VLFRLVWSIAACFVSVEQTLGCVVYGPCSLSWALSSNWCEREDDLRFHHVCGTSTDFVEVTPTIQTLSTNAAVRRCLDVGVLVDETAMKVTSTRSILFSVVNEGWPPICRTDVRCGNRRRQYGNQTARQQHHLRRTALSVRQRSLCAVTC
jgi:hypothetical protein